MKTMCPPSFHHSGFVATNALGHTLYGYTLLLPMNQRVINKPRKKRMYGGGHIVSMIALYANPSCHLPSVS